MYGFVLFMYTGDDVRHRFSPFGKIIPWLCKQVILYLHNLAYRFGNYWLRI